MRRYANYAIALCLLATASACKVKAPDSNVKFDASLRNMLNIATLGDAAFAKICTKHPIFFFVGNGEHAVSDVPFRAARGGGGAVYNEVLNTDTRVEADALRRTLAKLASTCSLKFDPITLRTGKDYRALLVTITDGYRRLDSRIQSSWFSYDSKRRNDRVAKDGNGNPYAPGWALEEVQEWVLDAQGNVVKPGKGASASFEMHLPTQLEGVVNFFLAQHPPSEGKAALADGSSGTPYFDQTLYFIKSHGGRVNTDDEEPNVENVFRGINSSIKSNDMSHAFLFDPNGPQPEPAIANVYGIGLKVKEGCELFAAMETSQQASPSLCQKCRDIVANLPKKGPFASCFTTQAADKNGKATLDANSNTTMDANSNTTMDANSNTTMDANSNTTMDANSNTTMDANSNTTMGVAGANVLSAGKDKFYTQMPDGNLFRGAFALAKGVLYSGSKDVDGMNRITLPLLGTKDTPPLVVLDSCWGNYQIGRETFKAADPNQPVVVAINPNPMGQLAMDYGALDYFQYLALPYVYNNFYTGRPETGVAEAKVNIDDYLNNQGLIGRNPTDIALTGTGLDGGFALAGRDAEELSQHQLKIFVLKNNKVYGGDTSKK